MIALSTSRRQIAAIATVSVLVLALVAGYYAFGTDSAADGPTAGADVSDRPNATAPGRTNAAVAERLAGFDRTHQLIRRSRSPTGGYSEFRPERPSVHSTHHFLRVTTTLDVDPDNADATRVWLRQSLAGDFRDQSIGTLSNDSVRYLRDYYDGVSGLTLLNATPRNATDVVGDVREFRSDDGSYCFAIDDRGECLGNRSRVLATYYAVVTLDRLDSLDDRDTTRTREWLLSRWQNESVFEDPAATPTAHGVVAALTTLGVDLRELDGYDRRASAIQNRRDVVTGAVSDGSMTLLELRSYYRTLTLLGGDAGGLDDAIGEHLRRARLDDGGYHVVGMSYSDARGTAIGVSLAAATASFRPGALADADLRALVGERALEGGGFAPAFQPRPGIDETYYAVSALAAFGDDPDDPRTRQWVERTVSSVREQRTEDPDLYATSLAVRTLRHLDERPEDPDALRTWIAALESPNGGFRPYPDADTSPSLRYSYWAVSALAALLADESETRVDRTPLVVAGSKAA